MKEVVSKAIANGDSSNPILASVVEYVGDPTIKGLVICNPDGSKIGNPFDYIQLKTDYTPTGNEPVGTSYWDSTKDGPVVKTESGIKEIAFTDDTPEEYYYYETDSAGATYYYFGYLQVSGDRWRIRRVNKTDYSVGWAVGNTDYTSNWINRASLTYNPTL